MKIISLGENLHEMSNSIVWENKKSRTITNLSSAELAQIKIKLRNYWQQCKMTQMIVYANHENMPI